MNVTNHDVFAPRVPMLPRDPNPKGWVYIIGAQEVPKVKIGFSVRPTERLRNLQAGSPLELKILAQWRGYIADEKAFHGKFLAYHSHGEWFRLEGEVLELLTAKAANPRPSSPPRSGRREMWPDGTSRRLVGLILSPNNPRTKSRMRRYLDPRPDGEPLERLAVMFRERAASLGVHPSWIEIRTRAPVSPLHARR